MAVNAKKSLALDANLLLDLAEGNDFAHDFREEFAGRGYSLLVPPTVLAELEALASAGHAPQCHFANIALEELGAWECSVRVVCHEADHRPSFRGTVARTAADPGNGTGR